MSELPKLSKAQLAELAAAQDFLLRNAPAIENAQRQAAYVAEVVRPQVERSQYLASLASLASTSLALDSVIAGSTGTASEMRELSQVPRWIDRPSLPAKSGEEMAIERVGEGVSQLARLTVGMAENTAAQAKLAQANIEQIRALVTTVNDLHVTTREGMMSNEKIQRTMLVLAGIVALPVVRDAWDWLSPVRGLLVDLALAVITSVIRSL